MKQTDSILSIKGVGEKAKLKFEKLSIETVGDLIEHYPREYEIFNPPVRIADLQEGEISAIDVYVKGKPSLNRVRQLKILTVMVDDGSAAIQVTWFNMPFLLKQIRVGSHFLLRGKVVCKNGRLVMDQPKIYSREEYVKICGKMMPVYGLTAGLTNNTVLKACAGALSDLDDLFEYLSPQIRKDCDLISIKKAISQIHFPKNRTEYLQARKRLVFDELFLYDLAISQLSKDQKQKSEYVCQMKDEVVEFEDSLPYQLTDAQQRVYEEILQDMMSGKVMNRLVQGDVGSGKTILAILVMYLMALNGAQSAFMVPTEVLAIQHAKSLKSFLEKREIRIEVLIGSMTAKEKREAYERIHSGESQIVVGTHAIIQDKVEFSNLGIVITDEQHRFGVKQRENLYKKGREPHVLAMSATPIPRTLALVLYGDMDLSVIDSLPANRLPIKNCVVGTNYRPNAYKFMKEQIEQGHQVYIICPMVEEKEEMELESVTEYAEKLKGYFDENVRIQMLHGKMKAEMKNQIMLEFGEGKIDILISTTVIEVGIDVPNATTIMIENAERFGLAQLHQLRGRVGRGSAQSYCILMAGTSKKEARKRLEILASSNDGFFIASEDLKLRGQGDLFGTRQSGDLLFKLADIYEDSTILIMAHEKAQEVSADAFEHMWKKDERLKQKLSQYTGQGLKN